MASDDDYLPSRDDESLSHSSDDDSSNFSLDNEASPSTVRRRANMTAINTIKDEPTVEEIQDEAIVEDEWLSPPLRPDLSVAASMTREEALKPWNIAEEPKPMNKFYKEAFQRALPNGAQIARDISAALRPIETFDIKFDRDNQICKYQQEAETLKTFKSTDSLTIGFLGPTGIGKSAIICNLCGIPGIAETSCLGSSCTSIPIEYKAKVESHTAMFHIEVTHLSGEELTEYVKELVWDTIQIFLPSAEGIEEDEYRELFERHEAALACLHVIFKEHEAEFDNPNWEEEANEGRHELVTEQFLKWTKELRWPEGMNESGVWKGEAHSVEEWMDTLAKFTQQGLWPLIKVVRNYSDAVLLKTGITLTDLPGLGDTNMARVRATQKYLLRCDHIFVLAKITRAVTDEGLQRIINKTIERYASIELRAPSRRRVPLSIIATHTDSIDLKEVQRAFCFPGGIIDPKEMEDHEDLINQAELDCEPKLKRRLKQEKKLWLIAARNFYVMKGLKEVYRSRIPGLKVFCVSNTLYAKYVGKPRSLWGKHVETSGIPAVRYFCHKLAAEDQFRDAESFLVAKIAALLNKVTIWADSQAQNNFATYLDPTLAQELITQVEKTKISMTNTLNDKKTAFEAVMDEQLLDCYREQDNNWNEAAVEVTQKWVFPAWHWGSYIAFCRHFGFYNKGVKKGNDWNRDLSLKMRADSDVAWETYEDGIPKEFDGVLSELRNQLISLHGVLKRPLVPEEITKSVDISIKFIEDAVSRATSSLVKNVRAIRGSALGFNTASLMFKEMTEAYKTACTFRGKGTCAKQRAVITEKVRDGNIFSNMQAIIRMDVKNYINTTFSILERKVFRECRSLQENIKLATRKTLSSKDREELENFETEKAKLAQTLRTLKKRHAEILESAGFEKASVKAEDEQAPRTST